MKFLFFLIVMTLQNNFLFSLTFRLIYVFKASSGLNNENFEHVVKNNKYF